MYVGTAAKVGDEAINFLVNRKKRIVMKGKKISIVLLLPAVLAGMAIGYLAFRPASGDYAQTAPPSSASPEAATEYTCAMHPQIRQPEPGICPLCEMDLTPIDASGEGSELVLTMTPEAMQLANIQTVKIGSGPASGHRLKLSGKVAPDERRAATQTAHVPGRIEQLYVTFTGEKVRQGQPLVRLYSPPLVNAQRELLEAVRLQGARSELAEAARQKIRAWKMPESFIQQVESSGQIRREVEIKADRSGVVMARKVAVGDYVEEGMALMELMDLNRVWVLLEAYESDLPAIRLGGSVQITTPAAPGRVFPARITFIDPLVNPQTRTVAIRAELDNPGALFKPEMLVEGTVENGATPQKTTLIVPKTAVLWTGKRSVVYVRVPDANTPSFEFREVELGEMAEDGYRILSGLEPGEEVVTQGAFVIDAAAQLNNQSSMMNRMVKQQGAEQAPAPDFRALVTAEFLAQWDQVVARYLSLKDALVATDPGAGRRDAGALLDALDRLQYQNLPAELRLYWQKNIGPLKASAKSIAGAKTIDDQRQQFFFLSERIIRNIQSVGSGGQALYLQHCPMAFNNKGGDWISAEPNILNPYFGDEMLRCGVVRDSFVASAPARRGTGF